MKRVLILAALLLAGAARAEPPDTAVEQSADMLLVGIPVVAVGLTFLLPEDAAAGARGFDFMRMTGAPRHDLGLALLRSTAVTYGLKYAVDEERPNGEDGSFPSGHTATTFAGAEFVRKQYGWAWGAPMYAAAGFVGWSRVATDDHWWHDVLAGAAIGVLSNHDLSEWPTRFGGLSVMPTLLHSNVMPVAGDPAQVPTTAPGLSVELRF